MEEKGIKFKGSVLAVLDCLLLYRALFGIADLPSFSCIAIVVIGVGLIKFVAV